MSFLAPLFFAGLAALAIPVLIHLIQRERKNVVAFPSLMFLRRVPYESVRRRRIHNWALLALRLAALVLIVAAFARPFIRGADVAAAAGGARDVVILLDRSYSMGYADQWVRARTAAGEVVNGLAAGDRATLVLFASSAEVAVSRTDDRARLLSEINASEPAAAGTRYGAALKLAGSLLAESTLPQREVVLVSDFQRHGWTPGEGLRLPDGTRLTPVVVRAPDARNLSVTPVVLQRETFSGQERVAVTAGVLNRGSEPAPDVDVTLHLDGRAVQTVTLAVGGSASASATFAPVTLPPTVARASVTISDDALARDNAFHFLLAPPQPVTIALVSGTRGGRDSSLYISRALSIGSNPRFDVTTRAIDGLTDDALGRSRVVMLNDVAVTEPVGARLQRFVEQGGGLFVVQGPQASWPAGNDLLPGAPTGTVDRSRGPGGTLSGLSYGHAIFEPFRAPRTGDFSVARFYGYRSVTLGSDAQVLARFDDSTPALIERAVGRGRVLVWSSTFDLTWNDLALKPVFLPFVHQLMRHLASHRDRASWFTVGQVIAIDEMAEGLPAAAAAAGRLLVLTPEGERLELDEAEGRVLELTEQGFYELREPRQGGPIAVIASNVELTESDRTPIDAAEIVAAVTGGGPGSRPTDAPPILADEAQERTQGVWWYLLFAGILLLTAESLLAYRLSRAAS